MSLVIYIELDMLYKSASVTSTCFLNEKCEKLSQYVKILVFFASRYTVVIIEMIPNNDG